ncbi:hypothetical protein Hanom_Chr14g01292891 [Helianthus anomalus]
MLVHVWTRVKPSQLGQHLSQLGSTSGQAVNSSDSGQRRSTGRVSSFGSTVVESVRVRLWCGSVDSVIPSQLGQLTQLESTQLTRSTQSTF